MNEEQQVQLFDLIMCLSEAVDLVSAAVVNHHKQVAYIGLSLGEALALPAEDRNDIVMAGALHDIGALSLQERLDILRFEEKQPHRHAEVGCALLRMMSPLSGVANLVRFHHVPWNHGTGTVFMGEQVPMGSHILHLADRIAVMIDGQQEVLGQVTGICERIEGQSGSVFVPRLVEAFRGLAAKEYFWLDATYAFIETILSRRVSLGSIELGLDDFLSLARLFSRIIDFRSRFTATHSSGVAATAEALARLSGSSEDECRMVKVAGYLHDLGKLAVPAEILEKPARLTESEFNVMRSHSFYTYRILDRIGALDMVKKCASFHHERLEGTGYPFHLGDKNLPMICRILAVADVFTAITEDRPYRKGMTKGDALQVLQGMAGSGALDLGVVSLMGTYFDEINAVRLAAQVVSSEEYENLRRSAQGGETR